MPYWFKGQRAFGSPLRSPRRIGMDSPRRYHHKKKDSDKRSRRSLDMPDLSQSHMSNTTMGNSMYSIYSGASATTTNPERALYKHIKKALQTGEPLAMIQTLILHNPAVVEMANEDGWYLLHYACYFQYRRLEVIEFLLKLFPAAVSRVADETRVTPLHLACFRAAPLQVIQLLLEYDKSMIRMRNAEGWTPLYFACLANAPLPVIRYLQEQWPIACLLLVDTKGSYPLYVLDEKAKRKADDEARGVQNPRHFHDPAVTEYIASATVDATVALMDAAANNYSSSKTLAVKTLIAKTRKEYDIPQAAAKRQQQQRKLKDWFLQSLRGHEALHHILSDATVQAMLNENKQARQHICQQVLLLQHHKSSRQNAASKSKTFQKQVSQDLSSSSLSKSQRKQPQPRSWLAPLQPLKKKPNDQWESSEEDDDDESDMFLLSVE